jgi:hypothetical protein
MAPERFMSIPGSTASHHLSRPFARAPAIRIRATTQMAREDLSELARHTQRVGLLTCVSESYATVDLIGIGSRYWTDADHDPSETWLGTSRCRGRA